MFLRTGIDVIKPLPTKVLVDNVLAAREPSTILSFFIKTLPGAGTSEGLLIWTIAGTVLIFLLSWSLGLASSYANIGFGQRMIYDLAETVYTHLQRLSLRFHNQRPTGDLIRRVMTDSGSVSTIVNDAILPATVSVFALVSMFIVMWQLDPMLTLLAMAVAPVMMLAVYVYSKPMEDLSYQQHETEGEIYTVVE